MNLGFVGLGKLGRQLAASLLRAGFPLTVHDRDRSASAGLVAAGAAAAASSRVVAEASDCVITCLPSPQAVSDVVTGPGGIIEGLRRGGTWIDVSTNDRTSSRGSPRSRPRTASRRSNARSRVACTGPPRVRSP